MHSVLQPLPGRGVEDSILRSHSGIPNFILVLLILNQVVNKMTDVTVKTGAARLGPLHPKTMILVSVLSKRPVELTRLLATVIL